MFVIMILSYILSYICVLPSSRGARRVRWSVGIRNTDTTDSGFNLCTRSGSASEPYILDYTCIRTLGYSYVRTRE